MSRVTQAMQWRSQPFPISPLRINAVPHVATYLQKNFLKMTEAVSLAVSRMLVTSGACFGCLGSDAYRRWIKKKVKEEVLKELEGSKALESLVERMIDQRQDERDEGEVHDVAHAGAERGPTEKVTL